MNSANAINFGFGEYAFNRSRCRQAGWLLSWGESLAQAGVRMECRIAQLRDALK